MKPGRMARLTVVLVVAGALAACGGDNGVSLLDAIEIAGQMTVCGNSFSLSPLVAGTTGR